MRKRDHSVCPLHSAVKHSSGCVRKFLNGVIGKKPFSSLSECYFAVKGAAVILPQNECIMMPRQSSSTGGEIQLHLQAMLHILRAQDTLKMAVRLESLLGKHTRYMAIVSTNGRQDNVESVILGIDYVSPEQTTIGLVLPIWASTSISLDGDGGISVESSGSQHIFKPVSVQAMWSAFQSLHKEHGVAMNYPYFPGGLTHTWVQYYESAVSSPEAFRSEWHYTYTDDTDLRVDSLSRHCFDKPPERTAAEKLIRVKLKDIMQSVDLDEVTSKDIREKLEEGLQFSLREYKEFIDQEMLVILGQMDKPSQIFPFLYLGTEWNASNWDELRQNAVGYIVNVTKEVDNFFPGLFYYMKIRVSDEESAELLKHWDSTYRFISEAKDKNSAVLVHCKKGISRSSSTVIAYAMKEYGWSVDQALEYVKEKRNCITPNKGFMEQLKTYQGILDASRNRNNELWNRVPLLPSHSQLSDSLVAWHGIGETEDPDLYNSIPQEGAELGECDKLKEDSVVYTEKFEEPPSSCGFPNVLVASENILKPFPAVLTRDIPSCSRTEEGEGPQEMVESEFGCEVNISVLLEVDEDNLPQLSHRPPVQKALQSVEQRIRNNRKQPDEVSLKDMQALLTRKTKAAGDSSGGSCSDSSSLASTSGDESEFTPDHSREGSASFHSKRRNSKSSSGESTGDSGVAELGVISSSPKTEDSVWNSEIPRCGSYVKSLSARSSVPSFLSEEVSFDNRPRGNSAPLDPEKLGSNSETTLNTHNRARKIIDKLLLRSTSNEATESSTAAKNAHNKFPKKPGTKWYFEVGKIAGSCRSRPRSEVLPGEWGGSPRSGKFKKQPVLKVSQPGNVKSQREKLERLSLEQSKPPVLQPPPKTKVVTSEISSVRKITNDLQSKAASSRESGGIGSGIGKRVATNSEENLVRSLVGVFEKTPPSDSKRLYLPSDSGRKETDIPTFFLGSGDGDFQIGESEVRFRRSKSLRVAHQSQTGNELDGDGLRAVRSLFSLSSKS